MTFKTFFRKPIVSVKLRGGLGNFMFRISAAYSVSLRDNKKFFCDVSDVFAEHKDFKEYEKNILRKIPFSGTLCLMYKYFEPHFHYSEIPKTKKSLKLIGSFHSEKYFKDYKKQIIELFEIDEFTQSKLIVKYQHLLNSENCSIHIRRGDYLKLPNHHPTLSVDYYKNAVEIIGQDKNFLIFSDDIHWCEQNFSFIKNKTFIFNDFDYEDLYLMSMCKNNIIANSSFSWWAAWLNENKDKKVVAPLNWFGVSKLNCNTKDLYFKEMTII